jgi:predicted double-glycine peptidase
MTEGRPQSVVRSLTRCRFMPRHRMAVWSVIAAVVSSGCTTVSPFRGLRVGEAATLITAVPPYCQDDRFSCGATCVIAVAEYWEVDTSFAVTNCARLRTAENLSAQDLQELAASLGLKSFVYQGSWEDVQRNLQGGRPLITLIPKPSYYAGPRVSINNVPVTSMLRWFSSRIPHWVIVIGHSKHGVILQDPAFGRRVVGRRTFEAWWKQKSYTCVMLTPHQQEPR